MQDRGTRSHLRSHITVTHPTTSDPACLPWEPAGSWFLPCRIRQVCRQLPAMVGCADCFTPLYKHSVSNGSHFHPHFVKSHLTHKVLAKIWCSLPKEVESNCQPILPGFCRPAYVELNTIPQWQGLSFCSRVYLLRFHSPKPF